MTFIRILCLCFLSSTCLLSQNFKLDTVVVLQNELPESSGLLYRDGVLITHNDSGDGSYLYEIDTLTGSVARTVYVANITAVDWEDLAADDTYLYIGDFGNNYGNRTNLAIYRVLWEDYWQSDTISADKISFRYGEQTDFSAQLANHPFDAETLLAAADGLYLFTKNWTNLQESIVYLIPKIPGDYTIVAIDSIATPGLVTGLDYLPALQRLLFVGYDFENAFVLELSDVDFNAFSMATTRSWQLPLQGSFKTEGLAYSDDRYAYLTKERNSLGEAVLYRLDTDFTTQLEEPDQEIDIHIFPNPVSNGTITLQGKLPVGFAAATAPVLRLLDTQGRIVQQRVLPLSDNNSFSLQLDVSALPKGVYFYEVLGSGLLTSGRVVVE
jgi:hypothetical protein